MGRRRESGYGQWPPEVFSSSNGLDGYYLRDRWCQAGVKSVWKSTWLTLMRELAPQSDTGGFVRSRASFHRNIGSDSFPTETGRYHVYLGNACPWCHRVLLALVVLGLEETMTWGEVRDDPERASRGGWIFDPAPDPVTGCKDLREVYDKCCGDVGGYRGRCTAPLLIDKKSMKIVSNESSSIIRNLNDAQFSRSTNIDLCPNNLRSEIDDLNSKVYDRVNNGVYKCGFATSQAAYDAASEELFTELASLNDRLSSSRFLLEDRCTEADLRLYPTMIRFDGIYATIFHCSKQRLSEFPNLLRWLRDVYHIIIPKAKLQISETIDLVDARRSYCELFPLNPSGIVYDGPDIHSTKIEHDTKPSRDLSEIFFLKFNKQ